MQPQRYGPFHYVPINRRPKITWPHGARVALHTPSWRRMYASAESSATGREIIEHYVASGATF